MFRSVSDDVACRLPLCIYVYSSVSCVKREVVKSQRFRQDFPPPNFDRRHVSETFVFLILTAYPRTSGQIMLVKSRWLARLAFSPHQVFDTIFPGCNIPVSDGLIPPSALTRFAPFRKNLKPPKRVEYIGPSSPGTPNCHAHQQGKRPSTVSPADKSTELRKFDDETSLMVSSDGRNRRVVSEVRFGKR